MQKDYLKLIRKLGSREAITRRFFLIFEYEPLPGTKRGHEEEDAIASLQTAARTASNYLRQCGNEVISPEDEDNAAAEILYNILCRRASSEPFYQRVKSVLADYIASGRDINTIPVNEFYAPDRIDLSHGSYLCIDGLYYAYLLVPSDGYKARVPAGWLSLLVNAGDGIDLDVFLTRQPKDRMIRKLGIRVQLNTECTPQMLRAMDPYAVFVATGSDEFIPPIDGLSGENVLSVREYIRSKPAVSGKQVVVLGAGQTGLEAARMLAQDNTVTVVDMMPDEIPANTDHRLDLFYAKDAGVQTVLGHRILRVDGAGVTVASVASGEERVLPADLVVVALGVRPVAELYNEIKDAFPHVCKLGDSVKPGFIVHATTAAYEAAASLPAKPYEVKEVYFAAEKEAVKPQLINPYA